ncbi:MAG: response regulator, partial [Deltaproteobacteria bacterium]|nr:response regulator [Deltaproteobacteria bacterium]
PERTTEIEFRNKILQLKAAKIPAPMGGDWSWLVIARDITQLKQAQLRSITLNEKLHQADRLASLGQMAAGIAHEINNPLSIILPNIDLLDRRYKSLLEYLEILENNNFKKALEFKKNEGFPKVLYEIPEIIAECKEAGARIQATTEEMRNFTRKSEDTGILVDVCELLESSMALVKTQIKFKARINKELPKGLTRIVAHKAELGQAFFNILLNAGQAIEGGKEEENWIRVSAEQVGDLIKVEIANTGEPIPKENIGKLFDPFFTTKGERQGTGLGLSICYDTVRKHGGKIEVSSGEDIETVFRIWIPLDTGIKLDAGNEAEDDEQDLERPKLLLIDDEILILKSYSRLLSPKFEIETVGSGEAAIEVLESPVGAVFDLILCDLMMPGVTGIDVYERIRQKSKKKAGRFIFLTGGTFTPDATRFLRDSGVPTISKPVKAQRLISLLKKYAMRVKKDGKVSSI